MKVGSSLTRYDNLNAPVKDRDLMGLYNGIVEFLGEKTGPATERME